VDIDRILPPKLSDNTSHMGLFPTVDLSFGSKLTALTYKNDI